MRTAAISMVRNEGDFIEMFVRANAKVIDDFYIVDDKSVDGTAAILDALRQEGYSIEWAQAGAPFLSDQARVVTELLERVRAQGRHDWIFLLDADEIVLADREELTLQLQQVPPGHCAQMAWQTFVPQCLDLDGTGHPLDGRFLPKKTEDHHYSKVIVPASLGACDVVKGSHAVLQAGRCVPAMLLAAKLAHFPIRSADQALWKMIASGNRVQFLRKGNLGGRHYLAPLQALRQVGMQPDLALLQRLASGYGSISDEPPSTELDPDGGFSASGIAWRYQSLAQINLVQRLDALIAELCAAAAATAVVSEPSGAVLVSPPTPETRWRAGVRRIRQAWPKLGLARA